MTKLIELLTTEEQLCFVYDAWLSETGYPAQSADELLHELIGRPDKPPTEHIEWLEAFIERWETVTDPRQPGPTIPKGYVKVEDHWNESLTKVRCWLTGFMAGRGQDSSGLIIGIPGADVLRQIQNAIKEAK